VIVSAMLHQILYVRVSPPSRILMKRVETTTLIANIIIDTEVACVDFFFHLFLLDFLAEEFSMFHLHLFACIASSIAGAGGD